MNIVERKSKKILTQGILQLAKKEKTNDNDVQLVVKLHNGLPEFFGLKNWNVNLDHIPINHLYPPHMDLFGVRNQIPVFLDNLMNDMVEAHNLNKEDIKLIISLTDDKKSLWVTVYNKDLKVVQIMKFKEVFGEQALMRLMVKQ